MEKSIYFKPVTISEIFTDFVACKHGYHISRCGNVEATHLYTGEIGQMYTNAGFYGDTKLLKKYRDAFKNALENSDCHMKVVTCSSFHIVDQMFVKHGIILPQIVYPEYCDLYLKLISAIHRINKKIVVVNHFSKEIEQQIPIINKIHKNYNINPDLFKVVHSYNTTYENPHNNYFETLEDLYQRTYDEDIDYYFLACGSYGMLLGDMLKNKGKKVIYIGALLQMLFGIMGNRFMQKTEYSSLVNIHWIYPDRNRYKALMKIENGCYI